VTLDDATGPLDATFFEDAQVGYATTVFHSWLLVVQGLVRRTGPRGLSMQAVGCWELPSLHAAWLEGGLDAVWALMATPGAGHRGGGAGGGCEPVEPAGHGLAAAGRRRVRALRRRGSGARLRDRLPGVALRRRQAGR
jgi:error-prone DNA polymerase